MYSNLDSFTFQRNCEGIIFLFISWFRESRYLLLTSKAGSHVNSLSPLMFSKHQLAADNRTRDFLSDNRQPTVYIQLKSRALVSRMSEGRGASSNNRCGPLCVYMIQCYSIRCSFINL